MKHGCLLMIFPTCSLSCCLCRGSGNLSFFLIVNCEHPLVPDPLLYILHNTWRQSSLWQSSVCMFLMISGLKFMVSRRCTSAVQVSTEIMYQRSYEVRRRLWVSVSRRGKQSRPLIAWGIKFFVHSPHSEWQLIADHAMLQSILLIPLFILSRMQLKSWTPCKLMLKFWSKFASAEAGLYTTTCQKCEGSRNGLE